MTQFFVALLRPGTRLMRDLSIRAKLATLAAIVTLGVGALVAAAMHEHFARQDQWTVETRGARAASELARLQSLLRLWRVEPLPAGQAAGSQVDAPALVDDLSVLAPALVPRWRQVQSVLASGACARAAAAEHCLLVAAELRALQAGLLQAAGLAPSVDTSTSVLADLALARLPRWADAAAALLGHTLPHDQREYTSAERWGMQVRAVQLTEELGRVREAFDRMPRAQAAGGAWAAARAASERQVTLTVALAAPDSTLPADDEARRRAARDTLLALAPLEQAWLDAQRQRLEERQAELRGPLLLSAGLGAAVLLGLAYFGLCFQRSVSGSLRAVVRGVAAAARGDLAHETRVHGHDEMAALGGALDDMARRLSRTVAEIRTSAVRVGLAGEELAQDGRALQLRTELQSERLRESAATVLRLGRSAAEGADTARGLHHRAVQLREQAFQGSEAVRDTMATIGSLEDSVRGVAEITGVIDDIAYQTNMLALNAAVEAAKAGEAGRGFAVVAAEVRLLAGRCAESAQQIRELIDRTTGQVEQSARAVRGAGSSLDGVVQGAAQVAEQLQAMAAGNSTNSQDLEQVAEVVGALKDLTQENGRAVERAARAGQSLSAEAERLRQSVASITLRHGSADEARALVQRALERVTRLGWPRTQASIQQPGSEFADRDLYVFAIDRDGIYRAMGARPDLVGRSVRDVAGITEAMADEFMAAAVAAADAGGGWIEYTGVNWMDLSHHPKCAYIAAVDDQLFIGCGVERPAGADVAPTAVAGELAAGPVGPVPAWTR